MDTGSDSTAALTCRAYAHDIQDTHTYTDKMRIIAAGRGHVFRNGRGRKQPQINFQLGLSCRLKGLSPEDAVIFFETEIVQKTPVVA